MNRIVVNRDKFKVDDIELTHGELTIGRENDNDLHFDHPHLSGHHAKIITLFDASHVEDLGSTNGTFVNGELITKRTLHDGDVITFADYRIMFSSDARQASASDLQETMILDRDDLMERLKKSESAEQHEHSNLAEISATESKQQQAKARPTPSIDDLEFLRKMQENLQQNKHNAEGNNVASKHPQPQKPRPMSAAGELETLGKVKEKNKQSTQNKADTTTAKITQRPVMQTSREELFMRKEEKKRLLSPVTVYFMTVAAIILVALLILPYLPV
jgi:pSer/pThr/pTyr-binding forkhead associated (FHA) protein